MGCGQDSAGTDRITGSRLAKARGLEKDEADRTGGRYMAARFARLHGNLDMNMQSAVSWYVACYRIDSRMRPMRKGGRQ